MNFKLNDFAMACLPLVRKIFKLAGLWGNEELSRVHLYIIRFAITAVVYYWFGVTYHLYHSIKDPKTPFSEKSNAFFVFTAYTAILNNFIVLYQKKFETKELFEALENFQKFGYPKNLNKISRRLDLFCYVLDCYCGIGCTAFSLLGYMQYNHCMEQSRINGRSTICGFSYRITYPYNINEGILLYIHLCLELSVGFIFIFGSHLMICSIVAVEMINIRLDHLGDLLKQTTNDENGNNQWIKLRSCIIYHIHIIKLAEKVNGIYQMGTTIIILTYGITVGAILIVISEKYDLLSIFSLMCYTTIVFLLCYSGQRLHDKSISIGQIAYEMDWVNSCTNTKNAIKLIIMRSNKPLTYSCAWGIGAFSMATFKQVMSAAYKFTSLKTSVSK